MFVDHASTSQFQVFFIIYEMVAVADPGGGAGGARHPLGFYLVEKLHFNYNLKIVKCFYEIIVCSVMTYFLINNNKTYFYIPHRRTAVRGYF